MYTNILYLPTANWSKCIMSKRITDNEPDKVVYPKITRKVVSKHIENFDYYDYEVLGYIVGGELTLEKPDKQTRKLFKGDWSAITESDVWNMLFNGDREPVTFWDGFKNF